MPRPGVDFPLDEVIAAITPRTRVVFLTNPNTPTGVPMQRQATLEAATRWCFETAQPGDAVLLSPACASLDMFRNYPHRAAVFVAEVQAIAAEAGVMT